MRKYTVMDENQVSTMEERHSGKGGESVKDSSADLEFEVSI